MFFYFHIFYRQKVAVHWNSPTKGNDVLLPAANKIIKLLLVVLCSIHSIIPHLKINQAK